MNPLNVPCSTCGSAAGQPCRTLPKPGIGSIPTKPHAARNQPCPAVPTCDDA